MISLKRHRQAGGLRPWAAGDLGAVADGGEGGLDRVRGPQMHPVLGGVVIEGEQLVEIVGDLRDGLAELRAEQLLELLGRGPGVGLVLSVPDPVVGLNLRRSAARTRTSSNVHCPL